MASFHKTSGGWRAQIDRMGIRKSKVCKTKAAASLWAADQETKIAKGEARAYPEKTLLEAFDRYKDKVCPNKEGGAKEKQRLDAIARDFPQLVGKIISEIDTPDLVDWRDARLKKVTPGSVRRDINLVRNVFTKARDEWKWLGGWPFKGFAVPEDNPPRDRRVRWHEVRAICRALNYMTGEFESKQQQIALAFLIALRTSLRPGEILGLSDDDIDFGRRVLRVKHKMYYKTKRLRSVAFTPKAARLLLKRAGCGKLFDVSMSTRDTLFREARDIAGVPDLQFRDSRGEALTQLAKKVQVLDLARISGHKDLKMLHQVYYRDSPDDIADKLR